MECDRLQQILRDAYESRKAAGLSPAAEGFQSTYTVDACLPSAGLRGPQEAVMYIVCVNILSGDHSKYVRGRRKGALASARPRSRSVEGGDGAGRTPHEAVIHAGSRRTESLVEPN